MSRWAAVGGCVAVVLASAACSGRSAEAYCAELDAGNAKIQANMDAAGDDAMAGLGSIFVNFGEYTTMLHKMQEKAPEEISGDLDDAVKVWDAQADRAGDAAANPLGALASTFMASMMASASMKNVDAYTQEHCGKTVFAMSAPAATATAPTVADTPTEEPSETPTPLAANAIAAPGIDNGAQVREGPGVVAVEANVEVAPGEGTRVDLTTSDGQDAPANTISVLAGPEKTKTFAYTMQGSCDWAVGAGADGKAVLAAQEWEDRPAKGLTEATTGEFLAAYDALTGAQLWRTEWKDPDGPFGADAYCQTPGGNGSAMTMTDNGYLAYGDLVFDLRDGSHRRVDELEGALGGWLLRSGFGTYDVLDPKTLKRRGEINLPLSKWANEAGIPGMQRTWQQGGQTVVATVGADAGDGDLIGVTLPAGKKVWRPKSDGMDTNLVGVADNGNVVTDSGVFTPSGKPAFKGAEELNVCAVAGNEVYVVGGTLVALDAATGAQGQVDTAVTECPGLPPMTSVGAFTVDGGSVVFDSDSTMWDLLTTQQ